MTGLEIKQAAQRYIDEMIDDEDAIEGINAGLAEIGDMALLYKTVDITTTNPKSWEDLPDDCTNVIEVVTSTGGKYLDWKQRGDKLFIADPGTYTVHHRTVPAEIAALDTELAVHPSYQRCLVTYLAAWWKLKDDDQSPDGLRLMDRFERQCLRVFQSIRRKKGHKDFTELKVEDGGTSQ